jgi:hypothetical protein
MKIEDYAMDMTNIPNNRPLTDETLKELGFVKDDFGDWWFQSDIVHIKYNITCCDFSIFVRNRIKYKTVGSVRMLIEALKGDE